MKIKYLAHACFLLTSDAGTRVITDPYTPNKSLRYVQINETADIVTISHGHDDHSNTAAVKGNPKVVQNSTQVKDINIRAVASFHDNAWGKERGNNTIFCFNVDGVSVCHMGDLGHVLSANQVSEIGKVDVVMVPIGGTYTIDAQTAGEVVGQVKAKIIIPMHFLTSKLSFPIKGLEEFTRYKQNVTEVNGSELQLRMMDIPAYPQIMALKPAMG